MWLAYPRRPRTCPYCGSERLAETKAGLVCVNCGMVVEETVFDYSSPYVNEDMLVGKKREAKRVEPALDLLRVTRRNEIYEILRLKLGVSRARAEAVETFINGNECVKELLEKLDDLYIKALTAYYLYMYAIEGRLDVPSTIVDDKNARRKILKIAKKAISRCLNS